MRDYAKRKNTNTLAHLSGLRKIAEDGYLYAIKIKNSQLIAAAIGRLNEIEQKTLDEEDRRRAIQIETEIPVDWDSPENRAIESSRQAAIQILEHLSGKSMGEILDWHSKSKNLDRTSRRSA